MTTKKTTALDQGKRVMRRLDALAAITEAPGALTRRYLTPTHHEAMQQVAAWMQEAGMATRIDAIANVIGRIEGARAGAPAILIGSHIDTVADAGKYDGNLGVIAGIEAAAALRGAGLRHAVEVVAFGDEEGVRFPSHLLSSRALTGAVKASELATADAEGVTVRQALVQLGLDPAGLGKCKRSAKDIAAYLEVHIEQGPVLQAEGLPLAAVTAINGATRLRVTLSGFAGHAGTVPMALRQDALAAAAEMVLAVERIGSGAGADLVATVGRLETLPGAPNVIPGEVRFTVDVRSPADALRARAVKEIVAAMKAVAKARRVKLAHEIYYDAPAALMDARVVDAVAAAITETGHRPLRLSSGAGHDAMAIAPHWPSAMMFVRCKDGISHNPAEAITVADADVAVRAMIAAVRRLDAASKG
jgi:allantoate deiminase